jgi:hypothetical protein
LLPQGLPIKKQTKAGLKERLEAIFPLDDNLVVDNGQTTIASGKKQTAHARKLAAKNI